MDDGLAARYAYIWEYTVRPDRVDDFERLYGPEGAWSELFRLSAGYVSTVLLHDRRRSDRYVTVDHWESYEAWLEWRGRFDAQFDELDQRGDELTTQEREIGRFDWIAGG